ncbi:MAG TPA: GH1 family beta-glucosidase [Candidatus Didemnitutus sp.]|nr:GH1 family beta-glucosidase [Candidatus Didemnitutus sp.]
MPFPKNFTWGVAAAAYQIEGAAAVDGRKPSVWDVFTHTPGKTFGGHTGDVACDHYHRWREDVGLMHRLGAHAYRLSLSWPRLIPNGTGRPNPKGIAFYDRLLDGLLAKGITPWVTLFHWDLPQILEQRGGFLNRDLVEWFGDYADLVATKFGDRVKHWMTFNEPPVIIGLGYQDGVFAPGHKKPFADCLKGAHHLLMAHGRAVQALRARCPGPVKIALAHTARERIPATDSARDIAAAQKAYFEVTEKNMWNLTWWLDPVFFGRYPADGQKAFAKEMPKIRSTDLELISQPLDLLAYNCYTGWPVAADARGRAKKVPQGWGTGNPRGTLPWLEIAPQALYWAARFQTERYGKAIVFSENGYCNTDFVHLDGKVHDPQRIDFLARYLGGLRRAVDERLPVAGYFHWSIMDNFEWAEGYKDRFGLIHVDYATQKRTPKDSYYWYRDVIRSNGSHLRARHATRDIPAS